MFYLKSLKKILLVKISKRKKIEKNYFSPCENDKEKKIWNFFFSSLKNEKEKKPISFYAWTCFK